MAGDLRTLLADLKAESDDLDHVVASGGPDAPATPTPAVGWSVGDTIGHLWFFDRQGRRALDNPEAFARDRDAVLADPQRFMADHLRQIRRLGESLLFAWREERRLLIDTLEAADPSTRAPWYGPSMSPMSFATARLMETWAHGQDVADALGVHRPPTDRIRHVAYLGVLTRGFSYEIHGRTAPDTPVHVALTLPSGQPWTSGDPSATDRIEGPALDFCLLVTQRRLADDLALRMTGEAAVEWMSLAQVFAGPPSFTDRSRKGLGR
ncbi:MAG TPA: TIGR03084 family metal-binding protein [Mycobacteriales bacterium]|nr:TIGR03084 family metal-binding protein [Mycobacteriales bacterium]